jgi:hypothetical protein
MLSVIILSVIVLSVIVLSVVIQGNHLSLKNAENKKIYFINFLSSLNYLEVSVLFHRNSFIKFSLKFLK